MANLLRGLGQVAGVAGKAIQGYGIDRENAVQRKMLADKVMQDAENNRILNAYRKAQTRRLDAPSPPREQIVGSDVVNPDTATARPIQGLTPKVDPPRNLDPNSPEVRERALADAKALADYQASLRPDAGDRVSAATVNAISEGKGQLDAIERARAGVKRYPNAVGIKRGLSLLPGMGRVASVVNQIADPEGDEVRQDIANVGSLKIRDRSGAAVTVGEFPRLAPFIPNEYDTPKKIKNNLDALERELRIVLTALQGGALLSDLSGGGASPSSAGGAASPPGRVPTYEEWRAANTAKKSPRKP